MEDIRDSDYNHAKRVCEDFEVKDLGKYHDLYHKSDILYYISDIYYWLMFLKTLKKCV